MSARRWTIVAAAGALLVAALAAWIVALNRRDETPLPEPSLPFAPTPSQVARGEALARAGNCRGCHTARGGAAYAGGRAIETPFGNVYAPNLTPDRQTGLGGWTPAQFWRALHNGRSRDGRLLLPVFPYPNYTRVTREDADALFAYLQSLPAVEQPNRPHELDFLYDSSLALAVWRALYFNPGVYRPEPARSAAWNRGAYLVRGLGHCSACHGERDALGGTRGDADFGGAEMPGQNWYAPSLQADDEGAVARWSVDDVVALLKTGRNAQASVLGPMAEVVHRSTQYLPDDDLAAIAEYLRTLPAAPPRRAVPFARDQRQLARGGEVYRAHCADCHGAQGEGAAAIAPALAGNRAVTMATPTNVIRIVRVGGYLPSTAGNPRPHGMPPFTQTLDGADIAAVVSYIRAAWGNDAAPVTPLEVLRGR